MPPEGKRTYVGFGFGAIQAGLFLHEARASGNFGRLVVAEVVPGVVEAVRSAGGEYSVNIAHADRLERVSAGPVEMEDPAAAADRERLVQAVADAGDIGTAVPSVAAYATDSPGSIHRVLAEGLCRKAAIGGPPAVIYCAENHNHAAEILREKVVAEVPEAERDAVGSVARFLNTVIGKMSAVVADEAEIAGQGLATVTPDSQSAFLVEAFNRILVSRVDTGAGFSRGITVFEEKDDLLPFEEAKLYGHNATHALAAYLGSFRGVERIAEVRGDAAMMAFLREAFLGESGAALVRKHAGVDDLFTEEGYRAYADDLLERMTNPFLRDTAARVGRDPERKLAADDRLVGTMRLAASQGVEPRRYAAGAAAALAQIDSFAAESPAAAAGLLERIWGDEPPPPGEADGVLRLVSAASDRLRAWREGGFGDPGAAL